MCNTQNESQIITTILLSYKCLKSNFYHSLHTFALIEKSVYVSLTFADVVALIKGSCTTYPDIIIYSHLGIM